MKKGKKQSSFLVPGLIIGGVALALVVTLYGASHQTTLDSQAANPKGMGNQKSFMQGANGRMSAMARVYDTQGKQLGTVRFMPSKNGVMVRVAVSGLTPGFHGFHIHDAGACIAPFTTAGGHWSKVTGEVQPNHTGDMPILYAQADGTVHQEFVVDRFSITDLFDANGSAVIIHGGPDNFANIPKDRYQPPADEMTLKTGDAGARVGCGVIEHGNRTGSGTGVVSGSGATGVVSSPTGMSGPTGAVSGPTGASGPTGGSGYAFMPKANENFEHLDETEDDSNW